MKWKIRHMRVLLNCLGVLILILGLGSAVLIYSTASSAPTDAIGYEVGDDGSLYPIIPEDSRQYARQLELYGGKENVLADSLRRWLVALWHGRTLAFTVTVITIAVSSAVLFYANYLQPPS
jgi:hypothetical protein